MEYSPVVGGDSRSPSRWRPWPLRLPFFTAFITLCILLCIAIELILRDCATDGCYVFGVMSTTYLSDQSNFVYNLLPTALSVVLGMLWALPHHDVLRLEPYFQMSSRDGATAADSLFLDYSYNFVFSIPFLAGKRKHYVVLLSSCILLLSNFFVTPLISGIFDDETLQKQLPGNATQKTLYKGEGSSRNTTEFAYQAYSYLWLEKSLPSFTTPTYAVLPVVSTTREIVGNNETWSAGTVLFEAELSCEMATFDASYKNDSIGVRASVISSSGNYNLTLCNFMGYDPNCDSDVTFVTPWTNMIKRLWDPDLEPQSNNSMDKYMIGWARGTDPVLDPTPDLTQLPRNSTAMYCNTAFYSQNVTATFAASSGEILSVNRTGVRKPFLNTMGFNEAIGGWPGLYPDPPEYSDSDGSTVGFGYSRQALPSTKPRIWRQLGPCPENAMESFAAEDAVKFQSPVFFAEDEYSMIELAHFALHNQTLDTLIELLDPETLKSTYERAFQLLFALWISEEMVDSSTAEPVPIMRRVWTRGFAVNKLWARGTQGGLAAMVIMVAVLGVVISGRRCELDGEPNSIAEGLRLLSESATLGAIMENAEFYRPEVILKNMDSNDRRYKLELIPGKGPRVQVIDRAQSMRLTSTALGNAEQSDVQAYRGLGLPQQGSTKPWMEKLWVLKDSTGFAFITFYAVVLGLLITAFVYSHKHTGLPTVHEINSFGYKVLYSYLPLAVGMSMEPILITLGSCYCMLSPYRALNANSPPGIRALNRVSTPGARALTMDYDKSPPQFQLFRSLFRGNFALAALSLAILLSNVLTVTFAGLFSPGSSEFLILSEVQPPGALKINGTFLNPIQDVNYILSGQLNDNVTVRNWTTPDYYVLPFYPVDRNISVYEGSTLGIGVDVECELVPEDRITKKCFIYQIINKTTTTGRTFRSHDYQTECSPSDWDATGYPDALYMALIDDPCIAYDENVYYLEEGFTWWWDQIAYDDFIRSFTCPNTFFAIWGDRPAVPNPRNGSSLYQNTIETAILKCKAVDRVVRLTATVQDEKVNSTSNIQQLSKSELGALYTNTSTAVSLSNTFAAAMRSGIVEEMAPKSSLKGFGLTWVNHLMATIQPSIVQNLTNITHIPNPSLLAETFQDVYRQLFVINLALYKDQVISVGAPQAQVQPARAFIRESRVNMSSLMFIISDGILLFAILVLVIIYWLQSSQVPGHAPTNLAAVYALLYASNAKRECSQLGQNPNERAKKLAEMEAVYRLGEFDGHGGKKHFGVYRVDKEPSTW